MFTFKRVTLLFFLLLFILNSLHFAGCRMEWILGHFCTHTRIYILVLFGLYLGISIVMAFVIRSGFHYPAICMGKTNQAICAITFDDGPHPVKTPEVLEILRNEQIPATFFLIGKNLQGNEDIVRTIDRDGQLIGHHSWSHANWFDFYPAGKMRKEFLQTSEKIFGITGKSPLLFRPPYGVINPMVSQALHGLPYQVIGWNIRSLDTLIRDPDRITKRILKKLVPGSIILLHDASPVCVHILTRLIPAIRKSNFQIVPLNQLIDIPPYA